MTSAEVTEPALHPWRGRAIRLGAAVFGVIVWVAVLGVVGFISSRPDPVIGDTAQQMLFTYVLLLPVIAWLGVTAVRRRQRDRSLPVAVAAPGRRRLLTNGAVLVGASLAGTGLVRTAMFAAADPQTPTTMTRSEHGSPGGERVLVAYQSQYGSTAEIANEVGATLANGGARVDVRHIDTIDSIADYQRVVVGGAIQYERWMSGAADFVRQHRAQLATTPVALFFTCLALSKPGDDARGTAAGYEQKIRSIAPEIEPVSVRGFAGVLDYSRMTPVTRIFARALLTLRGADPGDYRNWTEIKAWARGLDR